MNSARIVALSLAVLLSLAGYSLRGADSKPANVAELEKMLAKLREERLATATLAMAADQTAFDAGTIEIETLLESAHKLAEAQLSAARTAAQRVDACEDYLEYARLYEKLTEARFKEGFRGVSANQAASARYLRQSAEIALAEEQLRAAREK